VVLEFDKRHPGIRYARGKRIRLRIEQPVGNIGGLQIVVEHTAQCHTPVGLGLDTEH
jgi:hypothetical protein